MRSWHRCILPGAKMPIYGCLKRFGFVESAPGLGKRRWLGYTLRSNQNSGYTVKTIRNIFSIPELRNRIFFTLGILAVFRLGGHVPTPGINADLLQQFFEENANTVFGLVDIFVGGNFRRLTIFALGIMPYITASIILPL